MSSQPSIDFYNEDCLTGMRDMFSDKEVSVIVTSPPYNIGIDYGTDAYNDKMSREKYLAWMEKIALETHRVLADNGSLFLNLGSKPTDPYVPHDVLNVFRKHWHLQNTFLWVKSLFVEEIATTIGHFKPINSPRFTNDCVEFVYQLTKRDEGFDQGFEYIFHMTKTGHNPIDRMALGVPYEDESNKKRWKSGNGLGLHCRGNVWLVPYKTIQSREKDRGGHPATFPPQLAMNCMLTHGVDKISLVLDPFAGEGNTALAARSLGIDFVGFEIAEQTYKNAIKNVSMDHTWTTC